MKKIFTILMALIIFPVNIFADSLFQTRSGNTVPPQVESTYSKGLSFLVKTQNKSGGFNDSRYGSMPGVVGLCVIAFMAHGDDPNVGKYSVNIKRGIDFILQNANKSNGLIGGSMYNHGFATLALAEAYGVVHDRRIGPALQKAVNLLLTSQNNNPAGAWRYSPMSNDADTTISGACFVALIAAANAGIKIPDKSIQKALKFYKICQGANGGIGYTSAGGGNMPRTAIGCLVFELAKEKDSNTFKKAFQFVSSGAQNNSYEGYFYYYLYYASQAFFHADENKWDVWNKKNIKALITLQQPNGSWDGNYGTTFSTAAALLSLALNYRFLPIYER